MSKLLRASIVIPTTEQGVAAARNVVTALLPGWDLAELTENAELLVSELITNAYQHASGTKNVELGLERRAKGIRISLADGSAIRPLIRELSYDRHDGRGMAIVDAIATAWGADDHLGGKRVWVQLDPSQP